MGSGRAAVGAAGIRRAVRDQGDRQTRFLPGPVENVGEDLRRLGAGDPVLSVHHVEGDAGRSEGARLRDVGVDCIRVGVAVEDLVDPRRIESHSHRSRAQRGSVGWVPVLGEVAGQQPFLQPALRFGADLVERQVQNAMGVAGVDVRRGRLVERQSVLSGQRFDASDHLPGTVRSTTIFARERLDHGLDRLPGRARIEFEGVPHHVDVVGVLEAGKRGLEAPLADIAPRAHHIGPDIDTHMRINHRRTGIVPTGVGRRRAPEFYGGGMAVRAGVVVTGTEVLTGRVTDRNGPWVAEQLLGLGIDIGRIVIVGDRPDDLAEVVTQLSADHDLVFTTGGLGPTADDLTAAVVADVQRRPMVVDPELEQRISRTVEKLLARYNIQSGRDAMVEGVRKQALVPQGATVLEPVGTAPGLVVPPADGTAGAPVVVLPGPPRELRDMWPQAMAAAPVRRIIERAGPLEERTIRMWGAMEADLAAALRPIEDRLSQLEVSTCLRDGEIEIVTRLAPNDPVVADQYALLERTMLEDFGDLVFSTDASTVDDVVADLLTDLGWTIATAESCTGGLLAGRLTARAGSSAYVRGALVVYANEAKTALAGVPAEMIAAHGAVSREVGEALALGARDAVGSDVGVGITGIAGPGGGTADKPVGTVHLAIATPAGVVVHREMHLGGDRAAVRGRTVAIAMHELRVALRRAG